jgi:autotransporter strand-loop-strand O-heptosyltransferase
MDFTHNVIVNYISELPLKGDSPKVTIESHSKETFKVDFIDVDKRSVVKSIKTKSNTTITGGRQWYTNWLINVYDESGKLIHIETFSLCGKKVFIKFDSYALGDSIAWIPYVEEFRKKHNCTVICSTFYNYIFEKPYPEILFVEPNIKIKNIYAQYYIGACLESNFSYSPTNSSTRPLQESSSLSLGLSPRELTPDLTNSFNKDRGPNIKGRYVCISEHASSDNKKWKDPNGWEKIVKFLKSKGYIVVSISKEPTKLDGVMSLNGDLDLKERMLDLYHADFFIGVSSGLSWLSWSVGTHVFMISDITPHWYEFTNGVTRFCSKNIDKINYSNNVITKSDDVLVYINKFIEKN